MRLSLSKATRLVLVFGALLIALAVGRESFETLLADVYVQRSQAALPLGRYDEALLWLERAQRHTPANADIAREQGRLYERLYTFRRQPPGDAIGAYRQATILNPLDAEHFAELSRFYLRSGDLPAANQAIAEARERDPYNTRYLYTLGRIREAEGRLDEARAYYQQALVIHSPQVYIIDRLRLLRDAQP